MDRAGEGEGGMNWEIRFDINTLPCATWIASRNLLYQFREPSSVLCDDLVGWDGGLGGRSKREGIYVYM